MKRVIVASILAFVLLITFGSVVHAATISGSIYENDGTTLITGTGIQVVVWQGDPCGWRDWVTNVYTNTGLYTTPDLSEGTYYLQTNNLNLSNYVNEWWADPVSMISCSGAQSITVSTVDITGKDFQLDVGYSISGMVYQSDGSTPIPDNNVRVEVITGDPCDDREWMGNAETSVGAYTIMGIPPGDYYLQARPNEQSVYVSEWWAEPESVFYCFDAQPVTVSSMNVTDKDFILDIGGSITGVVVDDSGAPQANLEVEYENDLCEVWKSVNTAVDGSFEIIGLPPGPVEIEIEPDVDTGLVKYGKTYSCLAIGENRDLGTIELPYGALITGVVQDAYSNPLSDVDVWCGAKFIVAWDETDVDGSFALRIPVGTYTLNFAEEDEYSRMPVEITVNDVGTPQDLGVLTAYDSSSCEQILGTVDDDGYSGTGEFVVLTFLNTAEITPENFGGINIFAAAEPDQATGEYSLYVVPQSARPGTTVKVMLILFQEDSNVWESLTVIDEIENIVTGGSPVTGQNLAYSTSGSDYTVSGFVKNGDGGVVSATVFLYKQPGDDFFGFAETDCDGAYSFYNVSAGTYRIAATAYGYDTTEWTNTFNVVNTNVTIPDIFMGSSPGDELAVDFAANGLWHYDGSSWTSLASWDPDDGMVEWTGGLAVDFGASYGLWNYNGTTWNQLAGWNPENGIAWNSGLAVDFGGNGLWHYDGSWTSLASWNPDGMVEWTGGLAVNFGATYGLWNYDGSSWSNLAGWEAEYGIAWNSGLAVDFGSNGLWYYDGSSWTSLAGWNPDGMVEWAGGMAIDFDTYGLWNYDGTTWTQLAAWNPEDDMVNWTDGLAVDFGINGLWSYDGSSWTSLAGWNPEEMEAWANGLAVDFGATYGLWNYSGSAWSSLAGWDSEEIIDIDLY